MSSSERKTSIKIWGCFCFKFNLIGIWFLIQLCSWRLNYKSVSLCVHVNIHVKFVHAHIALCMFSMKADKSASRQDAVCARSSRTIRKDHMWQLCHHMWQNWQGGRDRAVWLILNMILKPTLQFRTADTSLECYVKFKTFLNLLNLQVDTTIIPESEGKFLFAIITSNEEHDNDKRRKRSLLFGVQVKRSHCSRNI